MPATTTSTCCSTWETTSAQVPFPDRHSSVRRRFHFPYKQTTICPLGPSAVSPVYSSILRFRDEYLLHIKEGACPYR